MNIIRAGIQEGWLVPSSMHEVPKPEGATGLAQGHTFQTGD